MQENSVGYHTPFMTTDFFNKFVGLGFDPKDVSYKNDACDSLFFGDDYETGLTVYLPNSTEYDPNNEKWDTFSIAKGEDNPEGPYDWLDVLEALKNHPEIGFHYHQTQYNKTQVFNQLHKSLRIGKYL